MQQVQLPRCSVRPDVFRPPGGKEQVHRRICKEAKANADDVIPHLVSETAARKHICLNFSGSWELPRLAPIGHRPCLNQLASVGRPFSTVGYAHKLRLPSRCMKSTAVGHHRIAVVLRIAWWLTPMRAGRVAASWLYRFCPRGHSTIPGEDYPHRWRSRYLPISGLKQSWASWRTDSSLFGAASVTSATFSFRPSFVRSCVRPAGFHSACTPHSLRLDGGAGGVFI